MNSTLTLTGAHLRTYNTIFQHPVSHNLGWHDVRALFRHVGEVAEEANGNFKVTRNGQTLLLHPARTKDVTGAAEVLALRHFLEHSETPASTPVDGESHWLLVISHHDARIFRSEMSGAVPQRILPHVPQGYFHHAPDSQDLARGPEKLGASSFFAPVAQALQGASQVLVFGSGTGASSEMAHFIAWLKDHDALLARRIIGTVVVDTHHLTAGELLAKAREFYAQPSHASGVPAHPLAPTPTS